MIENEFVLPEEMPAIPTKEEVRCTRIGCDNYDPSATTYCSNDCYVADMDRMRLDYEASIF